MFLAHFVGDVHQPLHVGFEEDEGGNTIKVHWYRRKENLHHVCTASLMSCQLNYSDQHKLPFFTHKISVFMCCFYRCGTTAS
jgi:hypothetical protein